MALSLSDAGPAEVVNSFQERPSALYEVVERELNSQDRVAPVLPLHACPSHEALAGPLRTESSRSLENSLDKGSSFTIPSRYNFGRTDVLRRATPSEYTLYMSS